MLRRRSLAVNPSGRRRARGLAASGALVAAALLSLATITQAREPRSLERQVKAVLDSTPASNGFWGIVVAELPGGKRLYSRNATHLFQPASNLKLFTTAAALEKLGPDFTTLTTVESDSPPDSEGRVKNLYIVGRGDANFASSRVLPYQGPKTKKVPQLSLDAIADLARQIAANGVRVVTGNLIADDSYFVYEPYPPDWAVDDLAWGYGAPVTALVFNDNTLLLDAQPAAAPGSMATVRLEPVDGGYRITNLLLTTAPGTESDVELARGPGSNSLEVYGSIAAGAPADEETVAVQDPSRLIAELLRQDLEKEGIHVEGEIEAHHALPRSAQSLSQASRNNVGAQSAKRDVLARHSSRPLREDIVLTDKVSQNLHAEILLRQLGRKMEGQGSREAGLKALDEFTGSLGIPKGELAIADGSGLSRQDLVAPDAIVTLLVAMARSPNIADFFKALPVAGVDGTLSGRFKGTPLEGRLHAKTGTIEHVNSLSGYMELPHGKRLAICIIGNADPLKSGQAEQIVDRIALLIYRYYARRHGRLF